MAEKESKEMDTYEEALLTAASMGHPQLIKALLRLKTKIDVQTKDLRWTPLMKASSHGHAACVQILLEGRAGPNLETADSRTALGLAAERGHRRCVRLLLEAGATDYKAALQLACDPGCIRLLKAGKKNKSAGKTRPKLRSKGLNDELLCFHNDDEIPLSEVSP